MLVSAVYVVAVETVIVLVVVACTYYLFGQLITSLIIS